MLPPEVHRWLQTKFEQSKLEAKQRVALQMDRMVDDVYDGLFADLKLWLNNVDSSDDLDESYDSILSQKSNKLDTDSPIKIKKENGSSWLNRSSSSSSNNNNNKSDKNTNNGDEAPQHEMMMLDNGAERDDDDDDDYNNGNDNGNYHPVQMCEIKLDVNESGDIDFENENSAQSIEIADNHNYTIGDVNFSETSSTNDWPNGGAGNEEDDGAAIVNTVDSKTIQLCVANVLREQAQKKNHFNLRQRQQPRSSSSSSSPPPQPPYHNLHMLRSREKRKSPIMNSTNSEFAVKRYQSEKCFDHKHDQIEKQIAQHREERPFRCDQCDLSFRLKTYLDKHTMLHGTKRPFECSFCGKRFVRDDHLKNHIRIHTQQKNFHCLWPDCDYRATQNSHVYKHVRVLHFHLPRSKKEQADLNIVDDRNAGDYIGRLD